MRRNEVRSAAALAVKMGIIGVERFHAEGDFLHPRTSTILICITPSASIVTDVGEARRNESKCFYYLRILMNSA